MPCAHLHVTAGKSAASIMKALCSYLVRVAGLGRNYTSATPEGR